MLFLLWFASAILSLFPVIFVVLPFFMSFAVSLCLSFLFVVPVLCLSLCRYFFLSVFVVFAV